MTTALDDPTERPQTLQRPQGGVNPIAIVALLAGLAAIVLLVVRVPTWIPLWFAAIGLFVAMISVLGSRPSAARWVSTVAIAASVIPFAMMPFYITT